MEFLRRKHGGSKLDHGQALPKFGVPKKKDNVICIVLPTLSDFREVDSTLIVWRLYSMLRIDKTMQKRSLHTSQRQT